MSASVIAFYSAVAAIVSVLFLALFFQVGLQTMWVNEEPIYRAVFPYYVAVHGFVAILAESSALYALVSETNNSYTRLTAVAGVFVPMLYLVLVLVAQAGRMRSGFSWDAAVAEWRAEGAKREANAAARRASSRERWRQLRLSVQSRSGSPHPTTFDVITSIGLPGVLAAVFLREAIASGGAAMPVGLAIVLLLLAVFGAWFWVLWPWRAGTLTRSARLLVLAVGASVVLALVLAAVL